MSLDQVYSRAPTPRPCPRSQVSGFFSGKGKYSKDIGASNVGKKLNGYQVGQRRPQTQP